MKSSFFTRWFHHHLEKQPEYIKKLLTHSTVLRRDKESVARSMAIALFFSCIPIPFHSVLAIILAIFFAANPLIAFTVLWIVNNPLTMAPIYYFCYRVGLWILQVPAHPFEFEQSWQWLVHELEIIWEPFLLGCVATGLIIAIAGYIITRLCYQLKK